MNIDYHNIYKSQHNYYRAFKRIVKDIIMANKPTVSNDHKFDIFSVEIGKRIRQARVDANLNQTELAKRLNKKQTSISEIERGKIEITARLLINFALKLEKPVSYFFPKWVHSVLQPEKITAHEAELLNFARKLNHDDLLNIIIQVRALAIHNKMEYYEFMEENVDDIDPGDV